MGTLRHSHRSVALVTKQTNSRTHGTGTTAERARATQRPYLELERQQNEHGATQRSDLELERQQNEHGATQRPDMELQQRSVTDVTD